MLERLRVCDWPGNVRELHNVIERAVSFAEGDLVELDDLPEHMAYPRMSSPELTTETSPGVPIPERLGEAGTFKDAKEQWVSSFEAEYIQSLLRKNRGNISHAAREADIDRKYFRKLMKKYDIEAAGVDDDDSE